MNKNAQLKREQVAEISQLIRDAHSVIVVSPVGVTVAEITALRAKFRAAGVDYRVLKNTLVRHALDGMQLTQLDDVLTGPSAFAFGMTDPVAPAKIIQDYITESKLNRITIKAGLVEGQYMDAKGVEALAKLPSRDVLIAKMMGSLNAPVTNFVGVLSATLRSLVYAVDAVRKQKAQE